MAQIAIEDLSFIYPGSTGAALDHIDIEIEAGDHVCICGPTGCGKTTLLRSLKPALAPRGERSGTVLFEGKPIEDLSAFDQSSQIGFIMQDPGSQLVCGEVCHEIAFGLENLGTDRTHMHMRVAEMASYFGLGDLMHMSVHDLSGGQKQMVVLASVLAMHPSVLIFDEPTSQLDPVSAQEFLSTVRRLNTDFGITVIICEHRLEEVFPYADKVVVLDHGRVVSQGVPEQVARELHAMESKTCNALPVATRLFFACAQEEADKRPCPLTVKDAKSWLAEHARSHGLLHHRAPDRVGRKLDGATAIAFDDAWFRYTRDGEDVLRGIDLKVPQGSVFALIGANGSGKTSLLKCLTRELELYRGSASVFGKKISKYSRRDLVPRCIAMMPQDPLSLFACGTVEEELREMAPVSTCKGDAFTGLVDDVVMLCGLGPLLDKHPFDLSGGEQQELAFAKVLLTGASIMLLDEPTKGMDVSSKAGFAKILGDLADAGATFVIVSHDIEFCALYADRVALLFDGKVGSSGSAQEVFADNMFYSTAANKLAHGIFGNVITYGDLLGLCAGK